MQRPFIFLVVWLLSFNTKILGQENPQMSSRYVNFFGKNSQRDESKTAVSGVDFMQVYKHLLQVERIDKALFKYADQSGKGVVGSAENDKRQSPKKAIIYTQPGRNSLVPKPISFSFNELINPSFFCRKELQMDKVTPIPIRIRLGSMDYVNYLEQKPNAKRF